MNIDEIALRQIVREEMKSALKEVGLHDDDAGTDVRDLRSLIPTGAASRKQSGRLSLGLGLFLFSACL